MMIRRRTFEPPQPQLGERPPPPQMPERWKKSDCQKMVVACEKLEAEARARKDPFMIGFWKGCGLEWRERHARGTDD